MLPNGFVGPPGRQRVPEEVSNDSVTAKINVFVPTPARPPTHTQTAIYQEDPRFCADSGSDPGGQKVQHYVAKGT